MKKPTRILIYLITLFFNINHSLAYSNYDECSILWKKIEDNFAQQSLDEPYLTIEDRFGIFINNEDDGSKVITSVHQKLSDQLYTDYDEADLHFSKIIQINGKEVISLSDEDFDAEFQSDKVEIKVDDYDDFFILKRKKYSSIIVDEVSLELHDVSSINTKTSQFDANFTIHSLWRDARYIALANAVYLGAPDNEQSGFFCKLNLEDVDKLQIFYPKIIPQRFITKRDDIFKNFEIHYEPFSEDICSNDSLFDTCSELELERGLVFFKLKENYLGTINDQFPVHNFPFDSQLLRFNLHPDRDHNFYYETQFNTTYLSDAYSRNAIYTLYSPEWEFNDWLISNDYQLDPASDQYYPTIVFDFQIERKNLYYIFKLMIPVIFLIVLSGMVFFIKMDDLQSRLTISVVCFLSLIAYIFVVDDELPKLGYLTFMDIFILISYVFSGLPTLQTVLIEQIKIKNKGYISLKVDQYFRRFYFLGYLVSLLILSHSFDLQMF